MNRLAILLSGLALTALPSTAALADNFSFSGADFSASGSFTYQNTPTTGVFLGNTVTGTAHIGSTLATITGIASVNTFLGNDNLYYTGSGTGLTGGHPFDFQGFAFLLSNGDAITLYTDANMDREILGVLSTGAILAQDNALITVTPGAGPTLTPEPGSLVLLGTGALGALGVLRRRFAA